MAGEDTKQGDAAAEETKDEAMKDAEKQEEEEEEAPAKPPTPPLIAAALRLDKSLGQSSAGKDLSLYSNPAKTVRRWLSTSSGAAGESTLVDISKASEALFDETAENGGLDLSLLKHTGEAEAMKTDESDKNEFTPTEETRLKTAILEVYIWLVSLKIRLLWKSKDEGSSATASQLCATGIQVIDAKLASHNSMASNLSSLYPLLARLWRYQVLIHTTPTATITAEGRTSMAQAHNAALLRRDVDTSTTLLNSMLHDLLQHSQVEQAQKLLSNSTFPQETATNNQLCRYLYYSGRIQALRLEYTSSYSNLSQAMRKAPTNCGLGFRITVQRLLIVVQLLMGEIPDRPVFYQTGMKLALKPYLEITKAVRQGDLAVFGEVVSSHKARLVEDETFTLISRLAHQVVKAGLRKLQLSYSRLSLQDVADRLGLVGGASQAEFVVAKAVRDGVLDATIHRSPEGAYVQSHEMTNVYATKEPAQAFHRRIAYCLTTHNDAVRAMRYPPDAYKKQLEASRGMNRKRGKDDKTDEEKAQELEDEMEEDY